jgi:hypothetical protein
VKALSPKHGRHVNSHFSTLSLLINTQLLNPVSRFDYRSMGDIERELGKINDEFLYNNAISYLPKYDMVRLQGDEDRGRVIIVFSEL